MLGQAARASVPLDGYALFGDSTSQFHQDGRDV
jgi:hypothetical protein